jgi:hypothetical protein
MNCTAFRAAIAAAIENRKALQQEVAAHIEQCHDPRCRADWDEALLLQRAIASWLRNQPQIDVAAAVVAAWRAGEREPSFDATLRTDRRPVQRSRSTAARAMVAISAAAIAALAVLLLSSEPDRMVVHRDQAAPLPDPGPDAGLAYVTYAQNAAQIVTDAVVLTLGGAEQMEDPKVAPIGIGWETDWPPLGEVHAALDDLIESLPSEPPPS